MIKEERDSIVNEAVEKALLALPDVFSRLALDHKAMTEITTKFYKDNEEFNGHEKSVAAVITETEGKNPTMKYEEQLKLAVPEIKRRISTVSLLDTENVNPNPNTSFQKIEPARLGDSGAL